MSRFIIKRVLSAVPLFFGLLTLTFFLIHLAPGDPVSIYIQSEVDPYFADRLRTSLGLDDPLPIQYLKWLGGVLQGELGYSYMMHAPVLDIILDTLPNTLLLTVFAFIINFGIGIVLGVVSAVKRDTLAEGIGSTVMLVLYAMPEFWLGLMMVLVFSEQLGLFPTSGMYSPLAQYTMTGAERALNVLWHMVLPVFVLGVASAASTARYMRSSILEVLSTEYIRTARAKGLPERIVIWKHALRNAMIPIVTLLGLTIPFLFGGAVVVESVFAWPGMGKLAVDAMFARDYPMIIGCTMVSGLMVILGNLVADILYVLIDPRIKIRSDA